MLAAVFRLLGHCLRLPRDAPGSVSSSDDTPSLLVIVGADPYKLIVGQVWLNLNLVPSVIVFLLFLFVASLLGAKFRDM